MQTTIHKQRTGLKVVISPMPGVKSVTALALIGVGSRFEAKAKNGISHFLEHMVFKGTAKWPKALDLSIAVDGIGADFNAFTGKEYTGFYVKSASRHLKHSLDVLTDMLYTCKLRTSDIEREKGVIVEEINMYNDLPQRKVSDLFEMSMYGDVGLGRRIDGDKQVVRSFSRQDFVDHLQDWYGEDNTCLALAGDSKVLSNTDSVLNLVREFFDKGRDYGSTTKEKTLGFKESGEVQVTVHTKQSDQAHFVMGFPSYPLAHPKRYALSLLSVILGGNMSSRLFTEVREKRGLAYYARVDVDRYLDTGALAAAEGVDVTRVNEAVTTTMKVFEDAATDGARKITEEELIRAKEYLAGSLTLSMEGSRNTAQYWATRIVLGDEVITPEEVLKQLRATTRDEVVEVAKDIIKPDKLVFALVGPFTDDSKFGTLIKGW